MATAKQKQDNIANDYSGVPRELIVPEEDEGVGLPMGSSTGEDENAIEAGGWQGTDDATSTAPSDLAFTGKAPELIHGATAHPEWEDPTGRGYGGGLDPLGGGVADLTGRPIEESRDWEENPI